MISMNIKNLRCNLRIVMRINDICIFSWLKNWRKSYRCVKKCFLFLLQLVVIEFSIKDKDFNDRFLFDHGQILSNLSVEYIYIVHTYT